MLSLRSTFSAVLSVAVRAHVDSAKELAKLYGQKFDLLCGSSAASAAQAASGSGPSQATVKCLEELKEVIGNHLKVQVTLQPPLLC